MIVEFEEIEKIEEKKLQTTAESLTKRKILSNNNRVLKIKTIFERHPNLTQFNKLKIFSENNRVTERERTEFRNHFEWQPSFKKLIKSQLER